MEFNFTATALRADAVQEAILTGFVTLTQTLNVQMAVDVMVAKGNQNGAVNLVKAGIVLDFAKAISDSL
jgi:hypothetical protein